MIQKWLSPVTVSKSFGNRRTTVHDLITNISQIDNAIIAGGALRDMYFGKHAKDIDVWCLNDMTAKALYMHLRNVMPNTFREHKMEKFEGVYEGMRVDAVRKITLRNGLQIDIIETGNQERDGFEIAYEFDLNINQFWLNGRTIRSTLPVNAKTTVMGKEVQDERQCERIKKFMDKYPEFDWMDFAHKQPEPYRGQLIGHNMQRIMAKRGDWVQQARMAINPVAGARAGEVVLDDVWN